MLLVSLLIQAAVPAQPAPAAPTLQQRFDAASLAAEEGRCLDAVTIFDAIEKLPAVQRSAVTRAALTLRRARCLIGTYRGGEAEPAIRAALPVLGERGAEFTAEIADARGLLATLAKQRGDYDGAIRDNEDALARATGTARIPMLLALADLTQFDHDGRALRYAEEARRLVATPENSKKLIAIVQTAYARVLLNEGRKAEAYTVLEDSLAKQGGLTMRVSLADLETRSDLAIAALVNNDREKAQNYLAYTGAGRLKTAFPAGAQMDLPLCGTDGLKPEDFAIISLVLADDGRVSSVSPIYVGGNRATALAFARAVKGWSWNPETAAKIPAIFRANTRVEVRCTTGVGQRLSLTRILLDAVPEWSADEQGTGTAWDGLSDAAALPRQRAALASVGSDRAARLRALVALLNNRILPETDRERDAMVAEAGALATALSAPVPLRLYLATAKTDGKANLKAGRALLADPVFLGDPLSAAVLRVYLALPDYGAKKVEDAAGLLDAAIAQTGLPDRHPVKVRALLLKANMLGATGDTAGARAALARTGLTAEQCSVAGVVPMMKRLNLGPDKYPDAARDMGFEGWVRTEFDVAADGRTVAPRTLVAYPPFIFNDAATNIVGGARFASSFQPDTAVACTANTMSIAFKLPK